MSDSSPVSQQSHPGHVGLRDLIRARIDTEGPITFATFMDLALYHDEHGYYRQPDRKPGRGGDFITSPELHPFFGMTLARQIADAWDQLGQPDVLTVREHGASSGGLAYDIMVALSEKAPDVLAALDYRLIDVNTHRLEEAIAAMAEVGFPDRVRAEHPTAISPAPGVVLANEVADALPVHRLIVRDGKLLERYVALDGDTFVNHDAALSPEVVDADLPDYLIAAGIDITALTDGAELDVSPTAARWTADIARNLTQGMAIIIDYGYEAVSLFSQHRLDGTVRGYAAHRATDDPYLRVGEQDLTAHVDFTWLERAASNAGMQTIGLTTQAEFLINLGLGDWLVELQQQPDTGLDEYYRAQAATMRLIDPVGLGRFRVLGLARDLGDVPTAIGFAPTTFADELANLR